MGNNCIEELENTADGIISQNLDFLREYAQIRSEGFKKALFTFSMIRLKASFEASMLLMKNGYFIELSSVFRLILEQLSWGCYLFSTDESQASLDFSKIKSPQQTISCLKTTLNSNTYGQLYGLLSEGAHLPLKEITRYIDKHADDYKVDIIFQAEKADSDDISILLLLIGTYVEVTCKGINHFGFENKAQENDFNKRYNDWYKEVALHLSELMLSDAPLIEDQ